jgi:hypothetical protein
MVRKIDDIMVSFRVNYEEKYRLDKEAEMQGKTLSDLVRFLIFNNLPHCSVCNGPIQTKIKTRQGEIWPMCFVCAMNEVKFRGATIVP